MSSTEHTHYQWLEWDHGCWFREHHLHAVVLTGFDVDEDDLHDEHRAVLDEVAHRFTPAHDRTQQSIPPNSVTFRPHPFGVGVAANGATAPAADLDWPHLDALRDAWGEPDALPLSSTEAVREVESNDSMHVFVARHGLRTGLVDEAPFGFLRFQGGASQTASPLHNRPLSERRAEAVRRYLWDEHGVEAGDIGSMHGLGESEPYVDAVARGLDDIEVAQNRYARFLVAYTYRTAVLDPPGVLDARLRETLENVQSAYDGDRAEQLRDEALGRYAMGRMAWRYVKQHPGDTPLQRYPGDTVESHRLPTWVALEANELGGSWAAKDRPIVPVNRYAQADTMRRKQMMALQDTWGLTAANKREGWERICHTSAQYPSVAYSLGLSAISESTYRDRVTAEDRLNVWHFFDAVEEWALEDHFEAVRPDFFWLDDEVARRARQIQQRAGLHDDQVQEVPWVLPRVREE